MKYFKKLQGERIYLSPMHLEDAELYTKWLNDPSTTEGLGSNARMMTINAEREFIEKRTENDYQFAIINAQTDTLMGNCGINQINHIMRSCVVGIFIGDEENRSKGFGSEAMTLLLDFCFNTLDMVNVMLTAFSFNERAIAAYKKVGFKEIGRRRQSRFLNGERHDEVFMDILNSEFNELHGK